MNHPQFSEVLHWLADGHTVQAKYKTHQKWHNQNVKVLLAALADDTVSHSMIFRKEPVMVWAGAYSFPLPLQEEPEAGTRVFIARPGLSPSEVVWTNTDGMRQALADNLLHLDAESAQMHVDVMTRLNNEAVAVAKARIKA